jgi:23S rRNA (adenine2503-C2)-methyltransferase
MMNNFFSLSRNDLESYCRDSDVSAIHAKAIFRNCYKKNLVTPWCDPHLPRTLSQRLDNDYSVTKPTIARLAVSSYDGSVKFAFQLVDGAEIESVLMPESSRLTLCLSSQVGCRQGCVFCHTGRMGLKRQLSAGEIVGQVIAANDWIAAHPEWLQTNRQPKKMRITNLVFMGMGEPLDNVEAVADAIDIFTDPIGMGLGPRRISVSTAGHLDGLKALTARIPRVRIALSLHTADHSARSRLMPINRRWPIEDVVQFLREYAELAGIHILVQYTLIRDVNDSIEDAQKVAELLRGMQAKINLIPLNEIDPSRLGAPDAKQIQVFRDVLHAAGMRTMVRYSKGQDIAAACGQLVR